MHGPVPPPPARQPAPQPAGRHNLAPGLHNKAIRPLSLGQLHCAPHTPHFLASDDAATWLTKPALLKGCTSKRVAEPGLQRSTKAAQTRQEGPLPPCSLCTLSGSARRRQHTSVPPRFACKDYNERRSHAKRTDGQGHPVLLSELRQGSQLAAVERSGLPDCTPR